jgi:hypothetical protein
MVCRTGVIMRYLVAAFLLAHGFAHLVGLAGAWQFGPAVPHKTTLLGGRIDLGEPGIRAFGVVWLVGALAFAAAAGALILVQPHWTTVAAAAAAFSLVISVLALPDARIGVWVNLALLGLLYLVGRYGWMAGGTR